MKTIRKITFGGREGDYQGYFPCPATGTSFHRDRAVCQTICKFFVRESEIDGFPTIECGYDPCADCPHKRKKGECKEERK